MYGAYNTYMVISTARIVCGAGSINQSLNHQFIYRDSTSHDDYNRTGTRKAARKVYVTVQRLSVQHGPTAANPLQVCCCGRSIAARPALSSSGV